MKEAGAVPAAHLGLANPNIATNQGEVSCRSN
jgi:hypothetical protein